MTSFSQRYGYEPVKSVIQVDSMDDELRNGLWNALMIFYWQGMDGKRHISLDPATEKLCRLIWVDYFKKPLDELDKYWPKTYEEIRNYFFCCAWNKVYDFIEFVATKNVSDEFNSTFKIYCNQVLKNEVSGYRFVEDTIVRITSEEEITAIEEAFDVSSPFVAVDTHMQEALTLLADRETPDYRNSIKESISAVEAISKIVVAQPHVTLAQALNRIERDGHVNLHPALKGAFDKLYGYTSNADGIRHALLDESNLDFEDAKFMLVACSAFINYLMAKVSKAGIELET